MGNLIGPKLGDLIEAHVDWAPGAREHDPDFWIVRCWNEGEQCGKPTRKYHPTAIGVRVVRTDVLLPDYLFYVMEYLYGAGYWQGRAKGTTSLKNIRVADLLAIPIAPR